MPLFPFHQFNLTNYETVDFVLKSINKMKLFFYVSLLLYQYSQQS